MVTTYAQNSDVTRILQTVTFSGSTTPTDTQVDDFINAAEDEIDRATRHAWRTVTVTDEFYDIPPDYGVSSRYSSDPGIPIHLRHREGKTLASGSGDKLEVWDGAVYVQWLTTMTEGRADDFWLDNEQGVLYLKTIWSSFFWKKGLRLTYRFGDATVPADIRDATAMLAAIKVLQNDDLSQNLNETGDPTRLSFDQRIVQWQKQIDKTIEGHTEFFVI